MKRASRILLWLFVLICLSDLQVEAGAYPGLLRASVAKVRRATPLIALPMSSPVRSAALLHLRGRAESPSIVSDVSPIVPHELIVARAPAPLYTSPVASSNVIATMDAGERLAPDSILADGSWIQVTWNGQAGWVQAASVQ